MNNELELCKSLIPQSDTGLDCLIDFGEKVVCKVEHTGERCMWNGVCGTVYVERRIWNGVCGTVCLMNDAEEL